MDLINSLRRQEAYCQGLFAWDWAKPRNNCLRNCPSITAERSLGLMLRRRYLAKSIYLYSLGFFPLASDKNFHNPITTLHYNGTVRHSMTSVTHAQTGFVGESGLQSQWVHQSATWIRSTPKIEPPPRWRNGVIAIFKIHTPYHFPGNAFLYYM